MWIYHCLMKGKSISLRKTLLGWTKTRDASIQPEGTLSERLMALSRTLWIWKETIICHFRLNNLHPLHPNPELPCPINHHRRTRNYLLVHPRSVFGMALHRQKLRQAVDHTPSVRSEPLRPRLVPRSTAPRQSQRH